MRLNPQDEFQVGQALTAAAQTVSAYSGTDVSHAAIEMLDILVAGYVAELMNCTPERLGHYQAAAKQAMALRKVFDGSELADPRI
jgi:hypothetical protein